MHNPVTFQVKIAVIILAVTVGMFSSVVAAVLDSVETRDGKQYRDVRWGPVNQGKVVMFHSRGVAIVPLSDLPEEFWGQFGYKPEPAKRETSKPDVPEAKPPVVSRPQHVQPNPVAPTQPNPPPPSPSIEEMQERLDRMRARENRPSPDARHWKQYNDERASVLLLRGKLVEKNRLKEITGFVVQSRFHVSDGATARNGTVLELAVRRSDTTEVANAMSLRPGLWRSTGEQVLLIDYTPDADLAGMLIRVYGEETSALEDRRCFYVGIEPSYNEWVTLRKKR